MRVEVDHRAVGVDDVTAGVANRRRAHVAGDRQQVLADGGQVVAIPVEHTMFLVLQDEVEDFGVAVNSVG